MCHGIAWHSFKDCSQLLLVCLANDTAWQGRRKDARAKFSGDITPKVFCILALVLYGAYVMTVTILPHDQNDETIISLVLGQLSGILGTCAAFFYGGSNGKK